MQKEEDKDPRKNTKFRILQNLNSSELLEITQLTPVGKQITNVEELFKIPLPPIRYTIQDLQEPDEPYEPDEPEDPEDPFYIFKKKIKSLNGDYNYITIRNMRSFLEYIRDFINTFIKDEIIKSKLIKRELFKQFHELFNNFNDNIINKLIYFYYEIMSYREYELTQLYTYKDYDLTNYTSRQLLDEIKKTVSISIEISEKLLENIDPANYYILHIHIILTKLLFNLYKIIENNITQEDKILLVYIPIKYIKLFIFKIHFRNKCFIKTGNKRVATDINLICKDSNIITNNDMMSFLKYIKKFINTFTINKVSIDTVKVTTYNVNDIDDKIYNDDTNVENISSLQLNMFHKDFNHIMVQLYNKISEKINGDIEIKNDDIEGKKTIYRNIMDEKYNDDNDEKNNIGSTSKRLVGEIKDLIEKLIEKLKILLKEDKPIFLYTLHISIILRRLLLDLSDIIEKKSFILEYIPIKYMKLFIYKIHHKTNLFINGGMNKKYKKTNNKISVIFEKKKYTRTIHINERKKYVKINKTFILLSKLKKI